MIDTISILFASFVIVSSVGILATVFILAISSIFNIRPNRGKKWKQNT